MKRQDFNQDWIYHKEGQEGRQKVTLPHDAMLCDTRDPNSPGTHANAYFTGGIYIYEKEFSVPGEWEGKQIFIEFGGIYQNSTIYINEKKAGGRPYGYVPFCINMSDYLEYKKTNTIRVVADNSKLPNSRWYTGGGIYRPVSLIVGNQDHIAWEGIHISTLQYHPAQIQVEIQADTKADESEVQVEIFDGEQIIAEGKGSDLVLDIPDARLWSEDDPHLYRCHVTLKRDGQDVDEADETFGIRKVEWSPAGFFVNGKETLLRGACIHHDNGILGACTYQKAEERRVRILKKNGYNAIRMSHHPAGRYLLEACDKYGLYVMDETFDMWYYHKNKYDYASCFNDWYLEDMKAMVSQDFNHPSVLMYSIGNEVSEPYKPEGVEKAKEMIDYLHGLDKNRAVTAGINLMIIYMASKGKGIYKEEGGRSNEKKPGKSKKKEKASGSLFFNMMVSMMGTGMNKQANSDAADQVTAPVLDTLDIAGYNYASGRYLMEKEKHPDRIIVGTETFPQDIAKNWKMVKELPYLIGDFMWTGWDYIGEAAIGAWNYEGVTMQDVPYPWLLADVGAIDIIGTPGAEMKYAATVWGLETKPYIGVRPLNHPGKRVSKAVWRGTNALDSWSWKNCGGNKAEVEVYADAAYVTLSVNGKNPKRKKIKDYKAMFKTSYESGSITAKAYDSSGRMLGSRTLKSATGNSRLWVKAQDQAIKVDEITYVEAAITGENGIVESNDDHTLTVSVENGELLGFGSANPCTTQRFGSGTYTTYYGRALAAVRGNMQGTLTVSVSGEGIESRQIEIAVTGR